MLGVSLIELMISLTIGLIVIAAIGYAYIATRQSFRNQDVLGRMQEDARTAFEIMGRDVRMTGFMGCATTYSGGITAPAVTNTGAAWHHYWYPALLGYENTGEASIALTTPPAYPAGFPADLSGTALAGVAGFVAHGDVLTVKYADNSQQNSVKTIAGSTITLNTPASFQPGQILLSVNPNCSAIDILTVSAVASSTSFTFTGTSANTLGPTGSTPGSAIYPLVAVTYYISVNANGNPSLYRQVLGSGGGLTVVNALNGSGYNTADELIEGVQDMQLVYGVDSLFPATDNPASAVNSYLLANNAALAAPFQWLGVLGVRVSLLMVSRQSEQGITTQAQPYALDMNGNGVTTDAGEAIVPTDLLFRKVFTTTMAIQNRI